jgi:hypothetical protein
VTVSFHAKLDTLVSVGPPVVVDLVDMVGFIGGYLDWPENNFRQNAWCISEDVNLDRCSIPWDARVFIIFEKLWLN